MHRLTIPTLAAVPAAIAALALATAAPASNRSAGSALTERSTAAWCAAVIRINTRFGTMRNKHYLPANQVSDKMRIAVYEYALAHRSQLLAITPGEIKRALQHELAFFARLKANHYARTTSLAPMTIADFKQLTNFQRTRCGITGL